MGLFILVVYCLIFDCCFIFIYSQNNQLILYNCWAHKYSAIPADVGSSDKIRTDAVGINKLHIWLRLKREEDEKLQIKETQDWLVDAEQLVLVT